MDAEKEIALLVPSAAVPKGLEKIVVINPRHHDCSKIKLTDSTSDLYNERTFSGMRSGRKYYLNVHLSAAFTASRLQRKDQRHQQQGHHQRQQLQRYADPKKITEAVVAGAQDQGIHRRGHRRGEGGGGGDGHGHQ